jgi:hypothetical protein
MARERAPCWWEANIDVHVLAGKQRPHHLVWSRNQGRRRKKETKQRCLFLSCNELRDEKETIRAGTQVRVYHRSCISIGVLGLDHVHQYSIFSDIGFQDKGIANTQFCRRLCTTLKPRILDISWFFSFALLVGAGRGFSHADKREKTKSVDR